MADPSDPSDINEEDQLSPVWQLMKERGLDEYDMAAATGGVASRFKQIKKVEKPLGRDYHLHTAFILRINPYRLAYGNALPIPHELRRAVAPKWTLDLYLEMERLAEDDSDKARQEFARDELDTLHRGLTLEAKSLAKAKKGPRKPKAKTSAPTPKPSN